MKKLHIDIETYSDIDIRSSGSYRYMESPNFEILMIAYAFDDEPVKLLDLTKWSLHDEEFLDALHDPGVEKHAHNANFERNAFRAIGHDIPIDQWRCSMIQAAYCGLPLGLGQVSKVLKLTQGKFDTGKALIRYFCMPCKPTKTNGKRTRNLPDHEPEKWEDFCAYCVRDVEAEREVTKRLGAYELPQSEKEYYALDQEINDYGIRVDLELASCALAIDQTNSDRIAERLIELTGVENPNSVAQLKEWLSQAMKKPINSLAKDSIKSHLKEAKGGAASEVLRLRQRSSKTSIKKYIAIQNCVCSDGRVRGLFQFYGASRTGRWSGRLVQLQNLPRNKLSDMKMARDVVLSQDYDGMAMFYDNVSGVLSQLVRTAFIPKPGYMLAVSDFSAIEARVTAWLAGEQWRMDVFADHGKIYEASAAMMFSMPIEQVTKDSPERQKGKVAELALGYGGSVGALKNMGGESMGLSEIEMKEIVRRWRSKNKAICQMWKNIENAAKAAVKTRRTIKLAGHQGLVFNYDGQALTIQLPSGRSLFYWSPGFGTNRFGGESLKYKGMDQTTKKWWTIETYGGKLVENIVQAVARDLLAYAMAKTNRKIVMHVHDEIVCEVPSHDAEQSLETLCKIMSEPPGWAPGLPLDADGFITNFYKKE